MKKEQNGPEQDAVTETEKFNCLPDYGPLTDPVWRRGDPATEMGLRLGILTAEDLEENKKGEAYQLA